MSPRPTARLTGALVARNGAAPARREEPARPDLLRAKPTAAAAPGRSAELRVLSGARRALAAGPAPEPAAQVRVGLRLDLERHLRLKLLAAHEQRSQQSVLIQALDEYLARHAPDVRDGLRFGPK